MIVVGGIHRLGESLFFFFFCGERKYSIYLQGVKQENVQQIFKGPELPSFQQAIFKIKNKGKYLKCVINSWILQIVQSFF